MEYYVELNVPEEHLGEEYWIEFIAKYHGTGSSAPELDDVLLGKGKSVRITPEHPVTLEALSEEFWNLTFRKVKKVKN